MDERFESKIASLVEVVGDVPKRLREMSDVVCSAEQIGKLLHERRQEKKLDADEERLSCSITNLRNTLQEAFATASKTPFVNSVHRVMHTPARSRSPTPPLRPLENQEGPVSDAVFSKMSRSPKQAGASSPPSIVHLLGLTPPGTTQSSDSQQELLRDQNRLLRDVVRSLSDVDKKRDDAPLCALATEMCAGKKITSSRNTSCENSRQFAKGLPPILLDGQDHIHVSRLESPDSTAQSIVQSINTSDALSLCGVHLDESHLYLSKPESPPDQNDDVEIQSDSEVRPNKSESQSSDPGTKEGRQVSATEAHTDAKQPDENVVQSLQHRININIDQQRQSPSLDEPSSSSLQATESHTSEMEEDETNGNSSDKDTPSNEISSPCSRALDLIVKNIFEKECKTNDNTPDKTPSSHEICLFSPHELFDKQCGEAKTEACKEVVSAVESSSHTPINTVSGEVSVPGSMTSCDTVMTVCRPNRTSSIRYNPSHVFNPEPYQGWDVLLNEIQAHPLVRRAAALNGSTMNSNESMTSYGSSSFESEETGIT